MYMATFVGFIPKPVTCCRELDNACATESMARVIVRLLQDSMAKFGSRYRGAEGNAYGEASTAKFQRYFLICT